MFNSTRNKIGILAGTILAIIIGIVVFTNIFGNSPVEIIPNNDTPTEALIQVSTQQMINLNKRDFSQEFEVVDFSINAYQSEFSIAQAVRNTTFDGFENRRRSSVSFLIDIETGAFVNQDMYVSYLRSVIVENQEYWVYVSNNTLFYSLPDFRDPIRISIPFDFDEIRGLGYQNIFVEDQYVYAVGSFGSFDSAPFVIRLDRANDFAARYFRMDPVGDELTARDNEFGLSALFIQLLANEPDFITQRTFEFAYAGEDTFVITARGYQEHVFVTNLEDYRNPNEPPRQVTSIERFSNEELYSQAIFCGMEELGQCWIANIFTGQGEVCRLQNSMCTTVSAFEIPRMNGAEHARLLQITGKQINQMLNEANGGVQFQNLAQQEEVEKP